MSIEMHFVCGWTIQTAFDPRGKWKIKTSPGKARFFKKLGEARKWAATNPKTE